MKLTNPKYRGATNFKRILIFYFLQQLVLAMAFSGCSPGSIDNVVDDTKIGEKNAINRDRAPTDSYDTETETEIGTDSGTDEEWPTGTPVDNLHLFPLPDAEPFAFWRHDDPLMTCDGKFRMWDGAFRAFRDSEGTIHVPVPHGTPTEAFQLTGPDFLHLAPDCEPVMTDALDTDYSAYNHQTWLSSPYTDDGQTIHAALHMEFFPSKSDASMCLGDIPLSDDIKWGECRSTAVTYARSEDGGNTWSIPADGNHIIAVDPGGYKVAEGSYHVYGGFQEPSNIVLNPHDDHYYMISMMSVERPIVVNETSVPTAWAGPVLLRTNDLSDPSSWRAWGGPEELGSLCSSVGIFGSESFDVEFIDPCDYSTDKKCTEIEGVDPVALIPPMLEPNCDELNYIGNMPYIAISELGMMHDSLAYIPAHDAFVLVGMHIDPDTFVPGIYYALSSNLTEWTKPRLLLDTSSMGQVLYPALIDPNSKSMSFDTLEHTPWLMFVERFKPDPQDGAIAPYTNVHALPLKFFVHQPSE